MTRAMPPDVGICRDGVIEAVLVVDLEREGGGEGGKVGWGIEEGWEGGNEGGFDVRTFLQCRCLSRRSQSHSSRFPPS